MLEICTVIGGRYFVLRVIIYFVGDLFDLLNLLIYVIRAQMNISSTAGRLNLALITTKFG